MYISLPRSLWAGSPVYLRLQPLAGPNIWVRHIVSRCTMGAYGRGPIDVLVLAVGEKPLYLDRKNRVDIHEFNYASAWLNDRWLKQWYTQEQYNAVVGDHGYHEDQLIDRSKYDPEDELQCLAGEPPTPYYILDPSDI